MLRLRRLVALFWLLGATACSTYTEITNNTIEVLPHPSIDGNLYMINQGDLGDCWFLSGLGAITQAHPDYLATRLYEDPNGGWYVKFNSVPGPGAEYQYVHVAPSELAAWHGNISPGKLLDWPALFEIAYSKISSADWAQIQSGGDIFTGLIDVDNVDTVVAESFISDSEDAALQGILKLATKWPTTVATNQYPASAGPLVSGHGYVVTGFDGKTVHLYNVWGFMAESNYSVDTIEVALSYSDFKKYVFSIAQASF